MKEFTQTSHYFNLMHLESVESWFLENEIPLPIDLFPKYVLNNDTSEGELFLSHAQLKEILSEKIMRELECDCTTYIVSKNIVHNLQAN
jgi:hypothetical protein